MRQSKPQSRGWLYAISIVVVGNVVVAYISVREFRREVNAFLRLDSPAAVDKDRENWEVEEQNRRATWVEGRLSSLERDAERREQEAKQQREDERKQREERERKRQEAELQRKHQEAEKSEAAPEKKPGARRPSLVGVWKTTVLTEREHFIRETRFASDGTFQTVDYLPGKKDQGRLFVGTYLYQDGRIEITFQATGASKATREISSVEWLSESVLETRTPSGDSISMRVWTRE